MPWTTLFVAGNHENYDLLYSYPLITKFNGQCRQIDTKIYMLERGYVYTICNKTFFAFGGGFSIDVARRREGKSWWKQELPTMAECEFALSELEKAKHKVDFIITHDAPESIVRYLSVFPIKVNNMQIYNKHIFRCSQAIFILLAII